MKNGRTIFSLGQLNKSIQNHFSKVAGPYWIKAEVAQLTYSGGHAYLDLIEKKNNLIIAKSRANIWASELDVFKHRLKGVFNEVVKEGSNVLIEAEVEFHLVYGMSIRIVDIDASYSIGELERIRKEAIDKLEKEGAMDWQKDLSLPYVPQRLAIVSSKTAAGYEDFIHQLQNNKFNYHFDFKLFNSSVQGDSAVHSLVKQLKLIELADEQFDTVVIIRGGGAKTDLGAFDNYEIGKAIAVLSLPVLTGIGHERDQTIADMVAHQSFKTPTAVGAFLVEALFTYDQNISTSFDTIAEEITYLVEEQKRDLRYYTTKTLPSFLTIIRQYTHQLDNKAYHFKNSFRDFVKKETHQLELVEATYKSLPNQLMKQDFMLQQRLATLQSSFTNHLQRGQHQLAITALKVEAKDPEKILEKGYSMTTLNGKLITNQNIEEGDVIKTINQKVIIESIVKKVAKKD
ncbi:exodeoxyribonuclease VII large subunit [Flammeovirga kamogawensis]|uniref:Exodeoxyribonuclease 7 large subunit n=2 Tax=Flammeovirga kamogawensis TaxID=373891 RepID=A0ABX8GXQ9_9BACT|nr:exodeoxyribonuclease VII large subunit [Flammeovirga kamogawensis]MBB6460738.1 exodeoxyribonuclease VII large subunit [Flammeovirga kamogawensis]QWG08091.1 exodeoxyribonuclease VII large subunit [Flammeovirga kamogawensis]